MCRSSLRPSSATPWRAVGLLSPLLLFALAGSLTGCLFLRPVRVDFVSNRSVLGEVARRIKYVVDPAHFELTAADVRVDSTTLQYKGAEYVGDSVWVIRFSAKTAEQNPVALADAYTLLPVVNEGRADFRVVEDGERQIGGRIVRFVRYEFGSEVRNDSGQRLLGRGVVASFVDKHGALEAVYHLKLDNYGDRNSLDAEDLAPLIEPLDA